jgi:7-carboxy-7-deazaguanine synthase
MPCVTAPDVATGYLTEIFLSFQGEGFYAGRRHLFLRLAGCHLRCRYCDTPGSLERTPSMCIYGVDGQISVRENPVAPSDVLALALPLTEAAGGADGLAVTGGEPLLQAEFLAELLADARWPRPRLLETSGTQPDRLATVLPVVDAVSMDIKLPSNTGAPPFWDAHSHFLAASRGKAYVKVLVDESTDLAEVEQAARLVRREAPDIPVFLQPISTGSGRVCLTPAALNRFFGALRTHLVDVRVIPQSHKMLGIQ